MYAIVKTGGKQYTVAPGDVIDVEKIEGEHGDEVALQVLFVNDDGKIIATGDELAAASVTAQIIDQHKGKKQLVFKFKKRKGYKRTRGHRQNLTRLFISDVCGVKAELKGHDEVAEAPVEEPEVVEEVAAAVEPEVVETAAEEVAEAAEEAAEDLSKKTVAELKELAAERDIKIPSGARKAEIIELIENA